ncbi:hypothetical protein KAFR_0G00630 [Kazachstania africana CBS 2517]|uniref:Glycosyltransferase family 15 protein n=1 Tax=Kazachstania africana (strain ATCC 22294 / BCRC 22015 / CBS 2517 / CECT 1963 / NBRC 1671 / NRRL Y-8276) TaxID=1071382 RepID=H2AXJ6_KAZAF|nr:hypothetical protein KAFR_0G00630 [Kazachstania africana CBS 2517]CCF59096.1 hypothetical protein KAFR_0G00630 [Kazachstania africana CBS 2517]
MLIDQLKSRIRGFVYLIICICLVKTFVMYKWANGTFYTDAYYIRRSEEALRANQLLSRRYMLSNVKLSTNSYVKHDTIGPTQLGRFQRENATLLMLVRNEELAGALRAMRSLEDRFNKNYHYDWIFLNDVPFEDIFIETTSAMASGITKYAVVPSSDWSTPNWIDQDLYARQREYMTKIKVLHGESESYRNMCRFYSGFFFRQEVLDNYDYYFRVEPDVEYFCDFSYDPFKIMKEQNKKYGFVISLHEYEDTIPTLWEAVDEYIQEDEGYDIDMENNIFDFIIQEDSISSAKVFDSNSDYNLCHFWTNFEIADLNFFRSDKYLRFFNYLDSKGGFYYERWGDAPIHTIAASLFLRPDEVIHFEQIGYKHSPYFACPSAYSYRLNQRCLCDYAGTGNIHLEAISCLQEWWKWGGGKTFMSNY